MGTQVSRNQPRLAERHSLFVRNEWVLVCATSAFAALAVVAPFFFLGNASGHDFEFHLASWMDVARQWNEGIFCPRWAALANWGFGEPRFIFYPPASWMLGAALSFAFPWNMVPGVFIWITLTLAGLSMLTLAREWLPPEDAMAAAVLFAVNPYHLVMVYWRSDFAELLVSSIIPLVVLFALRTANRRWSAVIPLAVITAAVWLGNAPAAVIVTYAIALMLVVVSAHERSIWPAIYGGVALALGFALAAFYILPAAFEQRWVNISEAVSAGLRFTENFLFAHTADAEHDRFNFIVSTIAVGTIAATCIGVFASARLLRRKRRFWWVLLGLAVVSSALMFPMASLLWAHAPELRFVQFPWRWLLVLDVPFAAFVATALARVSRNLKPALWGLALVALAVTGFLLTRSNWWDVGGAEDFYQSHSANGTGYFGADEYAPRGSDHYDLKPDAPTVALQSHAESVARVEIKQWGPVRKDFVVHSAAPVTAALRLDDYPAWRVQINGKSAQPSAAANGQMLVSLSAGTSNVRIAFATTPDRVWGDVISCIAALGVLIAIVIRRKIQVQLHPRH